MEKKIHPDDIDDLISAEIPNEKEDPELFDLVKKHMLHGPCKVGKCLENNKCTKKFPRSFNNETKTSKSGYPLYRRRNTKDGGNMLKKNGDYFDNSWVVPYNPWLLR